MSSFSLSPTVLKGMFVVLTETAIVVPIPSFIPFQYNPNKVSRSLEPYRPPRSETRGEGTGTPQRAQPGPPTETISLTLELDATDFFEDPKNNPVGSIFGVAPKIASLEKSMYPTGAVIGALIEAVGKLLGVGGAASAVARSLAPIVLFSWGPSRILPVRVTGLKVDETGHTPVLYPALASVTVSLKVLPPSVFRPNDRSQTLAEKIAIGCYEYTSLNRDLLSVAGVVDTVAGIIPD